MSKIVPAIMAMQKIQPNHVTQLIEKTGLTHEEIAARLDCTARTVYRWEAGESRPKKPMIEALERLATAKSDPTSSLGATFRFIDLFAGIGGMRLGFESVGGTCVYTSEWDAASRKTYGANFPDDHPLAGDITMVPESEIPDHDVLLAGFPCQPFSIAGVSKKNALRRPHGFLCEAQGTLFFDVARIIAYHRPAAFLLENVKNLVSHDKGNTFRVIRKTLEQDLGYTVDWRVINAKGFVPQNRERIFIAGFRKDTGFDFRALNLPDPANGPRMSSVLHSEGEVAEPHYTLDNDGKVNPKYTLTSKLWNYLKAYADKHKAKGNGFGYGLVGPDDVARTLSARYYKDGSEILVRQPRRRPRRLTPRECARLMGFDRPGKPTFRIPVSDTQAYRQFGNAVVVPVVEAVADFMKPHILNVMSREDRQRELKLVYRFDGTEEPAQVAANG